MNHEMTFEDPTSKPLSYSRIASFLGCRKAYGYSYVEKLTRRFEIPRIQRGSLVDHGLTEAIRSQEEGFDTSHCQLIACDAIALKGREWLAGEFVAEVAKTSPSFNRECIELITEAQCIAQRAVTSLGIGAGKWRTMVFDGKLALQLKVHLPMESWAAGLAGYVDWVAEDKATGQVWVVDFKVRDALQSEDDLRWDYQLPIYQRAVETMLGRKVTGTAHFQIRSKIPRSPKLLKPRGKATVSMNLSRDVRGCTTDSYMSAVLNEGFDPSDYADEFEKLKDVEYDKFTPSMRGDVELEGIWQEVEKAGAQIYGYHVLQDVNPQQQDVRRLHIMQCRGCRFQELCMSELRGEDSDFIRETFYERKTR